jgi:ankyrin repeat protein
MIKGKDGDTALHLAAFHGHDDFILRLHACLHKSLTTIPLMEEKDALIQIQNTYGDTALHVAASQGHLKAVIALFDWDKE